MVLLGEGGLDSVISGGPFQALISCDPMKTPHCARKKDTFLHYEKQLTDSALSGKWSYCIKGKSLRKKKRKACAGVGSPAPGTQAWCREKP